jgi:hypothetical protein
VFAPPWRQLATALWNDSEKRHILLGINLGFACGRRLRHGTKEMTSERSLEAL